MNRYLSSFFDLSRWISSFLVVFGHVTHLLVVDINRAENPGLVAKLLYFITSFGHQAVVVFFVISGYLVGGITLDKWLRNGPNLADYAINRFTRIYTVLIPALAIGFTLDYLGVRWLDSAELYTNPAQYNIGSLGSVISLRLNFLTIVGNLLMLENISVPSLGSNGPLWSLVFEWWYYCLFCLAIGSVFYKGWKRWALFMCFLVLLFLLPKRLVGWMSIWLLGVGVFFVNKTKVSKPAPWAGLAVFIVASIISIFTLTYDPFNLGKEPSNWILLLVDFFEAVAYCFAIVGISKVDKSMSLVKFNKWAAGFSYSMYLLHFPILLFIVAGANNFLGWQFLRQPTLLSGIYIFALLVILYAFGYLISLGTERYNDSIRNVVRSLLVKSS